MENANVNLTNKEIVIQSIITAMSVALDAVQLQVLDNVLREKFHGLTFEEECTQLSTWADDNDYILKLFHANKKLEGCKDNTLYQYKNSVKQLFEFTNKNYHDITKDDVKCFMALRSQQVKRNTLVNIKHNLSTFFEFLNDEGYIIKNPVKGLKGIKKIEAENIYLTLDEEVAIRDVKKNVIEEAIVDFLLSTGVRVGELIEMDISNVDFATGTATFRGEKSDKIRTVVLDARAKLHLIAYLNTRKDNNPALFVTQKMYKGYPKRLRRNAIETITKGVGIRAGIKKSLTVHVFRRTFATRMTDKGCPLETLQELLGHASPETTKIYIARSQKRVHRAMSQYMDII